MDLQQLRGWDSTQAAAEAAAVLQQCCAAATQIVHIPPGASHALARGYFLEVCARRFICAYVSVCMLEEATYQPTPPTHLSRRGLTPERFQESRALVQQCVRHDVLVHLQRIALWGHIAGLFCICDRGSAKAPPRLRPAPPAALLTVPLLHAYLLSLCRTKRSRANVGCPAFSTFVCVYIPFFKPVRPVRTALSPAAATAAKVGWSLGPVAKAVRAPREPCVKKKTKPGCRRRRFCRAAGREGGARAGATPKSQRHLQETLAIW